MGTDDDLAAVADRLCGPPPEEFTAARDAAAKRVDGELRGAGEAVGGGGHAAGMRMSVAELHLLVPAAEQVDLLERHAGQLRLPLVVRPAEPRRLARDRSYPPRATAPTDAPPTPTHAQALAIVERCLGGRVIDERR